MTPIGSEFSARRGARPEAAVALVRAILIGGIIFASASPLFEGAMKTAAAAAIVLALILINRNGIETSVGAVLSLLIVTWVFVVHVAVVDAIHGHVYGWKSFGFWATMSISFVVVTLISKADILYVNERMIFYATMIGLPIYVVAMAYPNIIEILPEYTYGPYVHRTMGFVNFLYVDGLLIRRFTGFASEPGLVSMFYLWALWFRMSRREGRLDWQSVLYIVAMALTQSTAGIFLLGLFMVVYVRPRILLLGLVMAAPLIVYCAWGQIEYQIDNKLVGSASFDSRYARYFDFFDRNWFDVLFGLGNGLYDEVLALNDLGGWDSVLQIGQRYGFLTVAMLWLLLLVNNLRRLGVAMIVIITFASQSVWLMPAVAAFYFRDRDDC